MTERAGEEKRMRMPRREDEGHGVLLRGPGKGSARACKVRGRRTETREGEVQARRTAGTREEHDLSALAEDGRREASGRGRRARRRCAERACSKTRAEVRIPRRVR